MAGSVSRVLVAGGGPAAVEAALALRDLAGPRAAIELIAPNAELVVRPYDVLAPFHEGRERRHALAPIAADLGAEFVRDEVVAVDAGNRSVSLRSGRTRHYDALIVAIGARHVDAVAGAAAFRGVEDARHLRTLLMDSYAGRHGRVAFVVPAGCTWALPLYELALQTAAWLTERHVRDVRLAVVTPERQPLAVFGPAASAEVAALLESHGIEFITAHPVRVNAGRLLIAGGPDMAVDLAVAIPRLAGPRLRGLPADRDGFIPVDEFSRVAAVEGVFAAGDAAGFPVKQGGLATQQADAIAEVIAAELGAPVSPARFEPVLRAVFFGGRDVRYLRAELGREEETSSATAEPPWPAASKLVGRYLSPYLDERSSTQAVSCV